MKRIFLLAVLTLGLSLLTSMAFAQCTTIQSGTLVASNGDIITTGYDQYGYNYEAHMYNGRYCDYLRVIGLGPDCEIDLIMKWNEAWLSNKDCTDDGKLDRPADLGKAYRGSGAWCTNHQSGKVEVNGKFKTWTYFCKILAVPEDAVLTDGYWYTAENILIGAALWGDFVVTEEVYNDPSAGAHGILYKSPAGAGMAIFKP